MSAPAKPFKSACGLMAVRESDRCEAVSESRVRVARDLGHPLERARLGDKGRLLGYTPTIGFAIVRFDGLRESRETLVHPECLEPEE